MISKNLLNQKIQICKIDKPDLESLQEELTLALTKYLPPQNQKGFAMQVKLHIHKAFGDDLAEYSQSQYNLLVTLYRAIIIDIATMHKAGTHWQEIKLAVFKTIFLFGKVAKNQK